MEQIILKKWGHTLFVLLTCVFVHRVMKASEGGSAVFVSKRDLAKVYLDQFFSPVRDMAIGSQAYNRTLQCTKNQSTGQWIQCLFKEADVNKDFQNELFDIFLDQKRWVKEKNCRAFLQPLVFYAQSDPGRARRLFNRLLDDNCHHVIMELLTHLKTSIAKRLLNQLKRKKHFPPVYNHYARQFRNPFLYPTDGPWMSPGDNALREVPFENNHLPVLWITGGDMHRADVLSNGDLEIFHFSNDALYMRFESALQYSNWLVVASNSCSCMLFSSIYRVCNAVRGGQEYQKEMQGRIKDDWEVYQVPHSQYCVWVPKERMHRYRDILNITKLTKVKPIGQGLRREDLKSCPPWIMSKSEFNSYRKEYEYSEDDPKKIFKPHIDYSKKRNQRAVIDVLINGHGTVVKPAKVAGFHVDTNLPEKNRLTSLLNYFNDNLLTGTVAISSCSAGGSNKLLLQETSAGVPLQYNYNLILQSISDKAIYTDVKTVYYEPQVYFANAVQLESGTINMAQFCRKLVQEYKALGDVHGLSSIPQALLPGDCVFKGYTELCEVLEVASDMISKGEPIEIQDKRLVLWHGADIQSTVVVYPNFRYIHGNAPLLDPPIAGFEHNRLVGGNQAVLYPEFISMQRTQPIMHFKRIELRGNRSPQTGVLHFIRDAFFDVGEIASKMHIVIDELEGINDIPWQVQNAQQRAGVNKPDEFVQAWKQSSGQKIRFKNVLITIVPMELSDEYMITLVMLDPAGRQWASQFLYKKNILSTAVGHYQWHFKRDNVVIPTVESVGERLPSEGSRRFKKIKNILAGHLEQIEHVQQPISLSDGIADFNNAAEYPHATVFALINALWCMELGSLSNDQLIRFWGLVDVLGHSSGKRRDEKATEFVTELWRVLHTISDNNIDQFKVVLKREFIRAVLRDRKAIRETIAAKMNIKEEICNRFQGAITSAKQDESPPRKRRRLG